MIRLRKVLLNNVKKLFNNFIWRCRSVNEEKVIVRDALVLEVLFVIFYFVQSYNFGHPNIFKYFYVLVRMLAVPMLGVSVFDWAHEGDELAGNDPVEVTILNTFVILVLFNVESAEVIPPKTNGAFQALQHMKQRAIIEAVALGGISVVF